MNNDELLYSGMTCVSLRAMQFWTEGLYVRRRLLWTLESVECS